MANLETTNGHTAPNGSRPAAKAPNKLDIIHEEWVKKGSKALNKGDLKKLMGDFKAAEKKVLAAEAALAAARQEESDAVEAVVKGHGRKAFKFDGQVYQTSCRGERLYFKQPGAIDETRNFG